jgi:hypothetical protein
MRKIEQERITIFNNLTYPYQFSVLQTNFHQSGIMYKKDILNKCDHILFFLAYLI